MQLGTTHNEPCAYAEPTYTDYRLVGFLDLISKLFWHIHFPAVLSLCHHWFSINRDNHSIHLIVDHYGIQGGVDIQLALCHSPGRFIQVKIRS